MEQPPTAHERVEKILSEISKILEKAEKPVGEKLKEYVAKEPKQDQIFSTLELFSDQNYCITYNRFYVKDEGGRKVLQTEWGTDGTAESAGESFIPELDAYAAKAFDGIDYSDAEQQDFGPRHSKQLFEWFAKCWQAAGGEQSKTPTYFAMNKEYMCQDFKTGEIITEEETAKRLGHPVRGLASL